MVRRASGASAVHVPGVAADVRRYLEGFAAHWESRATLDEIEALSRFDLAVHSSIIWRATFNTMHPGDSDRWLTDDGMWRIAGPNTLEAAA